MDVLTPMFRAGAMFLRNGVPDESVPGRDCIVRILFTGITIWRAGMTAEIEVRSPHGRAYGGSPHAVLKSVAMPGRMHSSGRWQRQLEDLADGHGSSDYRHDLFIFCHSVRNDTGVSWILVVWVLGCADRGGDRIRHAVGSVEAMNRLSSPPTVRLPTSLLVQAFCQSRVPVWLASCWSVPQKRRCSQVRTRLIIKVIASLTNA